MISTHHSSVYTWRLSRQPYEIVPTRERSLGNSAIVGLWHDHAGRLSDPQRAMSPLPEQLPMVRRIGAPPGNYLSTERRPAPGVRRQNAANAANAAERGGTRRNAAKRVANNGQDAKTT
jgi:hypothetical protein